MEYRNLTISVKKEFFNKMKEELNISEDFDLINEALGFMDWIVEQRKNGREVISIEGDKVIQIVASSSLKNVGLNKETIIKKTLEILKKEKRISLPLLSSKLDTHMQTVLDTISPLNEILLKIEVFDDNIKIYFLE